MHTGHNTFGVEPAVVESKPQFPEPTGKERHRAFCEWHYEVFESLRDQRGIRSVNRTKDIRIRQINEHPGLTHVKLSIAYIAAGDQQ